MGAGEGMCGWCVCVVCVVCVGGWGVRTMGVEVGEEGRGYALSLRRGGRRGGEREVREGGGCVGGWDGWGEERGGKGDLSTKTWGLGFFEMQFFFFFENFEKYVFVSLFCLFYLCFFFCDFFRFFFFFFFFFVFFRFCLIKFFFLTFSSIFHFYTFLFSFSSIILHFFNVFLFLA